MKKLEIFGVGMREMVTWQMRAALLHLFRRLEFLQICSPQVTENTLQQRLALLYR